MYTWTIWYVLKSPSGKYSRHRIYFDGDEIALRVYVGKMISGGALHVIIAKGKFISASERKAIY